MRDQLRDVGAVTLRRMFGGYGLYADSMFCPNAKQTPASYYEVPPDVLEDAGDLVS